MTRRMSFGPQVCYFFLFYIQLNFADNGLNVLCVINEPMAAALTYSVDRSGDSDFVIAVWKTTTGAPGMDFPLFSLLFHY